jgi:hypothetical protein
MGRIGNNFVAVIGSAKEVDIYFACIRRLYYPYNKGTLTVIKFTTSLWPGSS